MRRVESPARSERVIGASANTFAEGIATRVTFDLTFDILKQHLDDFILLTEDELAGGVRLALARTHNLAEGAGSHRWQRDEAEGPTRGAARSVRDERGNLDQARLKWILGDHARPARTSGSRRTITKPSTTPCRLVRKERVSVYFELSASCTSACCRSSAG